MTKPDKIFQCRCADGFTGDFCEFKIEQDHLVFLSSKLASYSLNVVKSFPLVFNADGKLIEETAVIDEQACAFESCVTFLNGEAIIYGGWELKFQRQV